MKAAEFENKLNTQKRRKEKRQFFIIFAVILFFLMAYACLVIVSYMNTMDPTGEQELNLLACIELAFKDIPNAPLRLFVFDGPYTMIPVTVFGFIYVITIALLWYDDVRHAHDLSGIESGSAQWNDDYKGFKETYGDPDRFNTTLLSQNVAMSMNTRKTRRNNNVLIIGATGTGKSRGFVKPNILQMHSNYIITDPKGELLASTGKALEDDGYEIKVFNLCEMTKSSCYNPFHYIRDEPGVLSMINCLIKNTTPPNQKSSDPFWEKSETALLEALVFYLRDYRPVEEQNFSEVMRLLRWANVDEAHPDNADKLDRIFLKPNFAASSNSLVENDPEYKAYLQKTTFVTSNGTKIKNLGAKSLEEMDEEGTSIAVKQYRIFKSGAGKTAKSILISCQVRLTAFNIPTIANLTNVDNIHLEEMSGTIEGKKKQALYCIIPAADDTFNFLVAMLYSQLFETLYYIGGNNEECIKRNGALPVEVKFMLDEFANIGTMPDFEKKLATMRGYNISCSIILQNIAQIKSKYKDDWEGLISNCDSLLFIGSTEYSTLEYLSKMYGKQTITTKDRSMSDGKQKSFSGSYKNSSRELITPDELSSLPNDMCVLKVRGEHPFLDKKIDYPTIERYKLTGDYDEKNIYKLAMTTSKSADDEDSDRDAFNKAANPESTKIDLSPEALKRRPEWDGYPRVVAAFRVIEFYEDEVEKETKAFVEGKEYDRTRLVPESSRMSEMEKIKQKKTEPVFNNDSQIQALDDEEEEVEMANSKR